MLRLARACSRRFWSRASWDWSISIFSVFLSWFILFRFDFDWVKTDFRERLSWLFRHVSEVSRVIVCDKRQTTNKQTARITRRLCFPLTWDVSCLNFISLRLDWVKTDFRERLARLFRHVSEVSRVVVCDTRQTTNKQTARITRRLCFPLTWDVSWISTLVNSGIRSDQVTFSRKDLAFNVKILCKLINLMIKTHPLLKRSYIL